jgi:hypothetical protein
MLSATVQPGGGLKNIQVKGFPGKQILFLNGGTTPPSRKLRGRFHELNWFDIW